MHTPLTSTHTIFDGWISTAKKGDKFAYHVGSLMYDRLYSEAVNQIAAAAWRHAGMLYDKTTETWRQTGIVKCFLVQRKLNDPLGCEYVAIKK